MENLKLWALMSGSDTMVHQIAETVKRHEEMISGKHESSQKPFVNAVIYEDDKWHEFEKLDDLREGEFLVERSKSIGTQWCRLTPSRSSENMSLSWFKLATQNKC